MNTHITDHYLTISSSRGYTDRKKKIIREWNKTNSSPRPPETLTSDPLRQSYLPNELFQHSSSLTYNPYGVKDEPLRADYPYPPYGYPELVNPYHHAMTRREKRKKQDNLPGGNTLTRDERKVRNKRRMVCSLLTAFAGTGYGPSNSLLGDHQPSHG